MPIYTKTGDKGETSLFGGKRVSKTDERMEACGTIDELTSFLGLIASKIDNEKDITFLREIQKDLYDIMAFVGGAEKSLLVPSQQIERFEKSIDEIEKTLPKLTRFILPGGTETSSLFHIARTICRRAERSIIKSFIQNNTTGGEEKKIVLQYINRLSDLLFMYGRKYTKGKEVIT
ncbi:MAG: cob(I)yrinic acid a,c-diamide adenosyltransferase [bacterium]|nr:cob(I)yrinic acid a,c-diamide adenosyltransferase [bacterium]